MVTSRDAAWSGKLGQFESAAYAYNSALEDVAYGKVGALLTNRGRALLAAGQTQNAIDVLSKAVQDPSYLTPYKAYLALGSAYEQLGDTRNAGIAYRNAAVDEANPHPSGALRSLGKSFMGLGRPVDAVEAYRTALENCRLNHTLDIRIEQGGAECLPQCGTFDYIFGNINRNILLNDIRHYAPILKPGGCLYMSGFYEEDLSAIEQECRLNGLTLLTHTSRNQWAAVRTQKHE